MVFVDFAVDAIAGNAADVSIVDLAQMLAHQLHHLIFNRVAFCILGNLFHIRGMLAQFFVVFFVGTATTCGVTGEQAVYHCVGIATDGTGEMRVIVERQSEMPDVMDAVPSLHHGA